jgi:hypothetical protein
VTVADLADSPNQSTHQRDLFPGTDNPIMGVEVELPDPCPQCSSAIVTIGAGREPHKASLRCCQCGRHRGWISLVSYTFIAETVRLFGDQTHQSKFSVASGNRPRMLRLNQGGRSMTLSNYRRR